MGQTNYKTFFKKNHWGKFCIRICQKLQTESILITAIPAAGKRYFLKHIKEYYKEITKDNNTLIISFELIPGRIHTLHLAHKITELINFELNFPKYLEDLSCEETLNELVKRGKGILIIINRFERLIKSPETMIFLETLRIIDHFKIRFMIGCDISCLKQPNKYKPAGILTSSNIEVIPSFGISQTKRSIKIQCNIYGWKVPLKWAEQIHLLSGGNPGLMKYLIKYIYENKPNELSINTLQQDPGINLKLSNIYLKLKMNDLITKNKLNSNKKEILYKIGILDKNNNLKIKLLELLLKKYSINKENLDLKKVLSTQEYQLYQLFSSKPGEIISLDEISAKLWGEDEGTKYSLWSIYKTLSNLKRKLRKAGLEIKNYRGRGYTLTEH